MDIWRLKVFLKVIELEGFSKAAEAIHLTQPTVSSHIKDLENYFNCKLVDRMGKKTIPTSAGRLLYSHARRIIRLVEETEESMARFMGIISGNLSIGGSTIPGGYILPRLIGRFKQEHPGVNISLQVGDTKQIISAILDNRLDFGLVGAKVDQSGILQEESFGDEMRLVVPASHKWSRKKTINLKALLTEPFIIREKGSGTLKSLEERLALQGLDTGDFMVAAELGSTTSVIQGIKSGIGVSILSTIAVADEIKAKTLKTLFIADLNLKRHFYLTYHKNRTQSPLCTAFMDFLRKMATNKTLALEIATNNNLVKS